MDFNKELQDELNELSSSLSRLDKREGFEVPPLYFERLTDEVLRKAKTETEVSKEKQVPQWQQNLMELFASIWQPKVAIGLASVAVLVLAVNFFFSNPAETGNVLAGISEVSDEELSAYIDEYLGDVDTDLLASIDGEYSFDDILPMGAEDELLDEFYEQAIEELDPTELDELL